MLRELLKRLKEIKKRSAELRALATDDFTDELVEEMEDLIDEREKITRKITVLEGSADDDDEERSGDAPGSTPAGSGATVEDQPIYRSRFPLGEQMIDIRTATMDAVGAVEARERLAQVVKRENERPENRAAGIGMVEAVGSDGGFLLQGESAIELMAEGFNNNAVLSRTSNRTMSSQFLDIVQVDESSRATGSRGGGVRVYTDKELAQLTSSKTKFRKLRIEPKRLTGLYYASDEILNDAPMLEGEMSQLFTDEFSFKAQDLALLGSGSGEPLGVLNADCLVSQAKEGSQDAKTIVVDNITKMFSRVSMKNIGNLIWLINQDVSPQLDALAYGTTATNTPIYVPGIDAGSGSIGRLKGAPVVPVEQCSTLGTVGDILLVDLSQYMTANRGGINSASSIHLKFDYNQTTFRFVTWFDGQPKSPSAITPYKGSATVSPFVALATRA